MNIFRKLFFHFRYFGKPPWDTNRTPPELIKFIKENNPGRALDLGCGTGTNAITLAQNGWEVTGIDFIPRAIRIAKRKAKRAGVDTNFMVGDVTKLHNLKQKFDFILDVGCYHNLQEKGKVSYRNNLERLLALGGIYLVYLRFRSTRNFSGIETIMEDTKPMENFMELLSRQDGSNPEIQSIWLTYKKAD